MKQASSIPFHNSGGNDVKGRFLFSTRAGPAHSNLWRWAGFVVIAALAVVLIVCATGMSPMAAQASGSAQAPSSDTGKWVIVGTSDKGVFVTSDITVASPVWQPLNAGLTGGALQVNEIAVDPFDPKNVAYAATEVGIYKNTNWQGGGAWSLVFDRQKAQAMFGFDPGGAKFAEIKLSVVQRDLVFIVVTGPKTGVVPSFIARSEDGGASWIAGAEIKAGFLNPWTEWYRKSSSPMPMHNGLWLSTHDANKLWIAFRPQYLGGNPGLLRSDNKGATLVNTRVVQVTSGRVNVPYADNDDDQIMYFYGVGEILARLEKSTDGGATWQNITPPDRAVSLAVGWPALEVYAQDSSLIFATTAPVANIAENPRISVSADGGTTWATGAYLRTGQNYALYAMSSYADDSQRLLATVGDPWYGYHEYRGMVALSQDRGATWQDKTGNLWSLWGDLGYIVSRRVTAVQHDAILTSKTSLDLVVDAPDKLEVQDGEYVPNPFTVTATVTNTGSTTAENALVSITLPVSLTLEAGQDAMQPIGDLGPSQSKAVTWSVRATTQTEDISLTFSVEAKAENAEAVTVSKEIYIPGLPPRPIMFLHGICGDADNVGFRALIGLLERNFESVRKYRYVQDVADGCGGCDSQSGIQENGDKLNQVIIDLFDKSKGQKVTLISNSMGAAIIRSYLVDYRENASQMVDNVFFLQGAHQGAWPLLYWKLSSDAIDRIPFHPMRSALLWALASYLRYHMAPFVDINLLRPAANDVAPQSDSYNRINPQSMPREINYYNVFGDIQVGIGFDLLFIHVPPLQWMPLGDLGLLPGLNNPHATPAWGGARFLNEELEPGFVSEQWALTHHVELNAAGFQPILTLISPVLSVNTEIGKAIRDVLVDPRNHSNFGQNIGNIYIDDRTHQGGEVSIAQEICYILGGKDCEQ